ncbi:hypothetical protein ABK01_10225 [Treponema sp. OMZ 305]|uniref:hypothetical protein n=1 Tax=Treponema sp. OMZ 305 TaxID=1659192 RepID=UPI0020A38960|nr:hypothetical protein [Treponema sp. OMZ 305]UTC58595.1 hypothetical protein ABK01_10225 [Treponema sp. OMZ 305]
MKKNIMRIFVCFSIIYTAAAVEFNVPKFNFGISGAKQPGSSSQFSIVQESSINFRLLHGERFYSDLNLALYVPDVLRFFHPEQQSRTPGQFTFIDFSLNFPNLGGKPLILSIFTGEHQSLTGERYSFDFLKHGMRPVKMYENDIAALFTPPRPRESVGISAAGLILNTGYVGGSFGWNGRIKKTEQEYGIYTQGGVFSNAAITNTYLSFHITDNAAKISGAASLSVLFIPHNNVAIFTQVGLHKTNFRSATLKQDVIGNIYAFFEPRIMLEHVNFDFTFFVSKIRDTQSGRLFPVTPLIKPFTIIHNELYGGLNMFFGFGNIEFDKMQGGFHSFVAMPITRPVNIQSMLIALTPFYTWNIGPCDLDLRCSIYPLLYATPTSMFEAKIALKRNL